MFCSNCGTAIPEGNPACPSCGNQNAGQPQPALQQASEGPAPLPAPPPPSPGQSKFLQFISFELMITPLIMKILYVVGVALIGISTLIAMFSGFTLGPWGILVFFGAIIGGVMLQVFWRVICEQLILFFSMHEQLKKITKNKEI